MIENAIIIKMIVVENSEKRRNSNVSTQNLIQILNDQYDNAKTFIIDFLSRLNLIRTSHDLKNISSNFFMINRAKTLLNIFNVFSKILNVFSNFSIRSIKKSTISIFFFRSQISFFAIFVNFAISFVFAQTSSTKNSMNIDMKTFILKFKKLKRDFVYKSSQKFKINVTNMFDK